MSSIRHLPERLIGKIAAGEVVERPASVVKELVENALDAGAREVSIDLGAGGKRRIEVADDGRGMDGDDALLAFDRHATSKIAEFDDLERVSTLGFRGEALASIAAVARVTLTTAQAAGSGRRVRIEGGRVRGAEPEPRDRGTTVEVGSLFFNVPARRKFLKSVRTELRRCLEVTQGYALARPDVRFTLRHEGRELLDALPAGEGAAGARRRVGHLFGRSFAEHLVEIGGAGAEGERIWGLVGDPWTARGRRLFTFVNRRLIRDRALLATFYRSVRGEWRSEEFPALFLFVDLPTEAVDVNVHPQKAEVRFRDPRLLDRVGEALRRALRDALGEEPAPLAAPERAPSAPLAWQGLGRETEAGEVRDGSPPQAGRLAQAALAPLERRPVPLTGRGGEARPYRLLGQYKGTLILLEGPDGLLLVDQHVAHERVLYERLRRELTREQPPSQGLLEPRLLELAPAEQVRLGELGDELDRLGFALRELSGGTLGLTAAPPSLAAEQAEAILLHLARGGSDEEPGTGDLAARLLDSLAASLACRRAVKMHEPLSAGEMESLVEELFAAEQPYACPHGRPIVLEMTDRDLEIRFGRR